MNKKLLKGYILLFLVLLLYLTITVPIPKTAVFWMACGFSALAFLAQIYTLHTVIGQEIVMKDRALDFPKLRISVLYLIIQFVVSLILMNAAAQIPVWTAAAIEVGILLLAAAGFYAVEAACAEVKRQNGQNQQNMENMQRIKERLSRLILHCEQEEIQKSLRKLADEIQFANPTPTDCAQEIEEEITSLLTEIEAASLADDADTVHALCHNMMGLLKERDSICKNK